MIRGGYYIKARKIQESDIAFAPPHVREIWDWLLKEANHTDNGPIKRGQTVRSYSDIQEGLKWMIGYRKEKYSKWQCEIAMKWLTKHDMITTMKTTRGMIITICNYDYYQSPENYESHTKADTKATRKPQTTDTINKNDKNDKNKNNTALPDFLKFWKIYDYDKNRDKCENIWSELTNNDHKAILKILPYFIHRQIDREQQFRKTPEKFLAERVWEGVNDPGEQFALHGIGYHMQRH